MCQTMKHCAQVHSPAKSIDTEWHHPYVEHEAWRILHWIEKFHHYRFARDLCIIIDHKPLVANLSKDYTMLSLKLQHIMLQIYQCRECIICKPGPDLYITDWQSSKNHREDKDQEIMGMSINVNTLCTAEDVPV